MEQSFSNQQVLREIKLEIANGKEHANLLTFDEFWLHKHKADDKRFQRVAFLTEVSNLESFHTLTYYRDLNADRPEIPPRAILRRLKRKLVFTTKRITQKMVKFLLFPLVGEQNTINETMVRAMQHLRIYVNSQMDYADRLEQLERRTSLFQETQTTADDTEGYQPMVVISEETAEPLPEFTMQQLYEEMLALREENKSLQARLTALEQRTTRRSV